MQGWIVLSLIAGYFLLLVLISRWTSKGSSHWSWFNAGKSAPWPVVAYGMVGTSLSGVTFLSVPGWVATTQFSYMQMVIGYLFGYLVIALVLLPLYYKLKVSSIYEYLGNRFGPVSHKTGAVFFLLSRTVGAAFRLYLVALIFQILLTKFGYSNTPFWLPVLVTIILIFVYTFKGGIKTVIWTDLVQTTFMLLAAVFAFFAIADALNESSLSLLSSISSSDASQWWVLEWEQNNHWAKHILSGAFVALAMTGLDQDMMQKNLTCPNIRSAQKNIALFCIIMFVVNLGFLTLGGALYKYGSTKSIVQIHTPDELQQTAKSPISVLDSNNEDWIPRKTDELFAYVALDHLPVFVASLFILGLIAAAYSSADSALTGLTTSFCIDLLGMKDTPGEIKNSSNLRWIVQLGFAVLLFIVILIFKEISEPAVISSIFKAAGYTYGPLLGLFFFGILIPPTKNIPDRGVPLAAIIAVAGTYYIDTQFKDHIGFLILPINGGLTFILLYLSSLPKFSNKKSSS